MAVYSSDKANCDEIQSSLWYSTTSALHSRVSWEFCMEQRDVLIRFRCVCVSSGWFGGADGRGCLKKWVMPNSGGRGAGRCATIQATPPTPRLPLFHPHPPHTSSPHLPSFINTSRARVLWTALMNRDEERGEKMSQSNLMMAEDSNMRGQLNYNNMTRNRQCSDTRVIQQKYNTNIQGR